MARSFRFGFRVTGFALGVAMGLLWPAAGAAVQGVGGGEGALSGRVVDASTGAAVAGADVVMGLQSLRAVTDAKGAFRFNPVPSGSYVIRVERIGYQPRVDTLQIFDGDAVSVTIQISVDPIELEGLVVTTRSLLLESRGYYERKQQGFRGFFMDRPAIEKKDPLYVADLFRSVPGVEVVYGSRLIMSQSVNFYDGGRGCEPSLWLDGIRSNIRNYDYIRPDHLEGIEVYTGGGAPGKYNDPCGTVVIWTRLRMRRR